MAIVTGDSTMQPKGGKIRKAHLKRWGQLNRTEKILPRPTYMLGVSYTFT